MSLSFMLCKEFICNICDREFERKYDLSRHINSTHGSAKRCKLCRKILKSGSRKDMRVRHLLRGCAKFQMINNLKSESELRQVAKDNADEYFGDLEGV